MATYGAGGSPSSSTYNYDSLVASSVANYRRTLADNISKSNPFFAKTAFKGLWESQDGGLHIAQDLLTGLGGLEPYDSYDELPLGTPDPLTQIQVEWRQLAAPLAISEKERKQNKHRIVSLIESRLKAADIGARENFTKHLIQGSLAGSGSDIREPYLNAANGAYSIDPLPRLIMYDPTANYTIGNINQNTYSFWRNQTKTSTATTGDELLDEWLDMYMLCAEGPGGPPDLIWTDTKTWQLVRRAYLQKYRATSKDDNIVFTNYKFEDAVVIADRDIPDVAANSGAGALTAATTKGTAWFINTDTFKVIYESETNWVWTEWQKPINQDVKGKHLLWMGNTLTNNRRKNGVIGNIARTLTFSAI